MALKMSAFAAGGSGTEFEINTSFTLSLLVGGSGTPPVGQVEYPHNITGVTVDGVNVVGDCLIADSIIERGDVEVSGTDNFRMENSRAKMISMYHQPP